MNSIRFPDIPDLQVWTSSLVRTKQTAAYTKAPKQHFHEIDEINAGKFDGYTYDEVLKSHPEEFEARAKDKLGYRYPEGKSMFYTFKAQNSQQKSVPDLNVLTVAFLALKINGYS